MFFSFFSHFITLSNLLSHTTDTGILEVKTLHIYGPQEWSGRLKEIEQQTFIV